MTKLPARTVYYVHTAAWEFNSALTLISLWPLYFEVMKLSLVDVAVMQAVVMVSNIVLEIPTGIIADLYSRRLSVIVGRFFVGLAYVLMGVFPIFGVALLAGFVEAIGDTCVSGALEAWITDEVGADQVEAVFLRGAQIAAPAHWLGVICSIALAALFNYQVPVVLGGLSWFALMVFLIVFMPETNFQRAPTGRTSLREQFRSAVGTFVGGLRLVRGSRTLMLLFVGRTLGNAFSSVFYTFTRSYMLNGLALPIVVIPWLGMLKDNVWFGVLEVLQKVFMLVGAEGVRRFGHLDKARILLAFHALMLAALFAFVLTGNFVLAFATWVVVNGLLDLSNPIINAWLNQNITSDVRATVLSMSSQFNMVGALGSSTALGAVGDRFGVRAGLALSGVLLLPLLAIFGQSARLPSPQTLVSSTNITREET